MSFADLERGDGPGLRGSAVPQSEEDRSFNKLKDSVSIQIFKIQSNVQGIQRLVDKLGTAQDGPNVRTSLSNLTDATRDMVKKSTDDVKRFAAWPSEPSSGGPSHKPLQSKLSKDFTSALTSFQRVQRTSAEKQKSFVQEQKRVVHALEDAADGGDGVGETDESGQLLQMGRLQTQEQVPQIAPQELAFQESLIAERETEIQEIETGIHELNEIFRDLNTIVLEQGDMLDNIETNVTSVAQNTSSAAEELTTAHEYQRKAGRRMMCLALILIIVTAVVLLAILS